MRRLIQLFSLCLALAGAARAEGVSLAEISAYLNGIQKAEANFTQVNADGSQSTGHIFIWRPGRIRFEYDAPDDSLVLSYQGNVAVFDARSDQPPQMFPLAKTPLWLILGPDIDLTQSKMVVSRTVDGDLTVVTAQDPKHPDYGQIRLYFAGNPVELKQWVTVDPSGQETAVKLDRFRPVETMSPKIFDIDREAEARGF